MPIEQNLLMQQLTDNFPEAKIELVDLVGDQNHYEVTITSSRFKNMNRIQQHRLVNSALSELLKGELHALSIKTKEE